MKLHPPPPKVFYGVLAPVILASGLAIRYLPNRHCIVHRVSLLRAPIKITYGLAEGRSRPLWLFPNANSRVLGGCVIGPTSPPFALVQYCPRCREAERTWFEKHLRRSSFEQGAQMRAQWKRWRETHELTY